MNKIRYKTTDQYFKCKEQQKLFNVVLIVLLALFMFPYINEAVETEMTAESQSHSRKYLLQQTDVVCAFYDLGIFAYEKGNYKEAENNFKKALKLNPDNPFYNYYLGKTYMKMEDYQPAKNYLNIAWKVNPNISGLKYDLAFLNYKMANYSMAAKLFMEVAKEDPVNVLAYYHAGINLYKLKRYKKALVYFIHAAQESPSIETNGYYYIGICYMEIGKTKEAIEKFEHVRNHAEPGPLRVNAQEWIKAAKKQEKVSKPYSIYFKISYKYDDNIRLEVEDLDIYTEEDAHFYFAGKYNFFNKQGYKIGVGYNHYQTWNNNVDKYDITGSILNLYGTYSINSFIFKFSYLPYYYWLNSDSYLICHQLKPEIITKINKKLITKLTYNYNDNNYLQNDKRDGCSNEIFLDTYYTITDNKDYLLAGVGYTDNDTSHPDHYYGQLETKLGISLKIPWEMKLGLTGKYYDKEYKNIDSLFGVKRNDAKYYGSISFSRKLYYAWLNIIAEFNYTKNDSNINDYGYKRRVASLSLTANY